MGIGYSFGDAQTKDFPVIESLHLNFYPLVLLRGDRITTIVDEVEQDLANFCGPALDVRLCGDIQVHLNGFFDE